MAASIAEVHHYTPLHYLPFIARAKALLSKPALHDNGFAETHFRSMSARHDSARGFGAYAFLTLHPAPPILKAKLAAGFPHIRITVPAEAVDAVSFDLCRFNVAMTRQLRRHDKPGFSESTTNGRYYDKRQIPVARTQSDQAAMLARYAGTDSMIEVLVPGQLMLPETTSVFCFSPIDLHLAARILAENALKWTAVLTRAPGPYPRNTRHGQEVERFVSRALSDKQWRGDGLEFDRL